LADVVKEFDPLDVTLIGETDTVRREPTPVAGLYAGRYQIERIVGRGGMGTVYRALDIMVGDLVALKVLDASVTGGTDQMEWFRREVRLARRITHPNVARTHDMGEQGGAHYITMEFVEGTTLQELLRLRVGEGAGEQHDGEARHTRQAMEPARAARVGLSVCEGLAAAHAAGVVHRDLKPANVLIERSGRVVLTDFGIARTLADENTGARTQGVVGTPLYMAPEQLSGLPVDQRADIYAFGLMFFEMVTGVLPFAGQTPIAAALARLTQPPPDPRLVRSGLPEPLAQLIVQCLAQKPEDRPASATEVAERLRAWLLASGESLMGVSTVTVLGVMAAVAAAGPSAPSTGTLTPTQQQVTTGPTPGTMTQGGLTQGGTRGGPGTTLSRPLRPLAPVPTAERALAVLPFRYVGPPDQSYLGDALTDELIDVLSRTRGLRVLGSGATAKFRSDRDPRAVGADLGVDAVVDATVQASAKQVRVAARLVEVASGTQLWSERFESGLEDLFELQDRISKRIAEALRVELSTSASAGDAPAEAVSLYLRGRRKLLAFQVIGPDGAIELLEQCIELAPHLQPALACHAIACMRAWFMPALFVDDEQPRDWEQEARKSVARALAEAPDTAETYLARAMLGVQLGEWREAVKALVKALEIAPTYAHAHQYLAQLQCEAGNTKEGLERARLAFDLEPSLTVCLFDMARLHALRGDRAECDRYLDMVGTNSRFRSPTLQFRLRVAAWFGDMQLVEDLRDSLAGEDVDGFGLYVLNFARAVSGDFDKAQLDDLTASLLARAPSPRFYTLMCQNCVEIYCARGFPEEALRCFQLAADRVLIDIEWTDRCPLLKVIRSLPGFAEARRKVRQRVQAMWSL
jgi:TolB-like protein/Tfp pilus assembly protein PilF